MIGKTCLSIQWYVKIILNVFFGTSIVRANWHSLSTNHFVTFSRVEKVEAGS
jgi:hypothetical protein